MEYEATIPHRSIDPVLAGALLACSYRCWARAICEGRRAHRVEAVCTANRRAPDTQSV
jgi:hypothetical protein